MLGNEEVRISEGINEEKNSLTGANSPAILPCWSFTTTEWASQSFFSVVADAVWTVSIIFCGLALLNCCILCSTLSLALTCFLAIWVPPASPPAPRQITSCATPKSEWSVCVLANLGPLEMTSSKRFAFLFSLLLAWLADFCSTLGRFLPSVCFLRTLLSGFEQRSMKSWSESSMVLH